MFKKLMLPASLSLVALALLGATCSEESTQTDAKLTIERPKDGATVTTEEVTIRGTATPGAEIRRDIRGLRKDDKFNADQDGKWEYKTKLEDGENSFEFFLQESKDTRVKLTVNYNPSSATATAEALAADETATAEAAGLVETATAEAPTTTPTPTPAPTTKPTPTPEPEGNVVLATDIAGGWLNIDFLWRDDPLQEAKQCVKSHADAEAVACFAFASQAAYEASEPESAGNFKGPLCWDARWQRNKQGDESGGEPWAKDAACPD